MSTNNDALVAAWAEMDSPLGALRVVATAEGLRSVAFVAPGAGLPRRAAAAPLAATGPRDDAHPFVAGALAALRAYFVGGGDGAQLPPLDLRGTPMQRDVWNALLQIPAGTTRTYQQLADAVGRPRAVRAIGAAVGANPVGVLVPCHRVIGAKGALTGYAGGLDRKRWLLAHEGAMLPIDVRGGAFSRE
ncbi:methylated-DNA--[protein]-cysteine S-methyltransferase [Demequina capsici]|uniref:methylated-DNA--[protein]-cysteine S-methyltransferase n=1 Tax=Demequina capsici TaxID=3075620 RepID=A0AA96JBU5_9MICO|nr:methylated-DNA--[protein]-cysteine S-methyltransferase [Demequina sp. PMTSA13]WNM26086.1 methylated-DNA--[protein]-cysteine S-methyltransferase [Demequina sp. PMTSA13]